MGYRLRLAAFFIRHSRAYLAAHWTLTVALGVALFAGFSQAAPASRPLPNVSGTPTSCSGGKLLVHFSNTDTTQCLVIVGDGFDQFTLMTIQQPLPQERP